MVVGEIIVVEMEHGLVIVIAFGCLKLCVVFSASMMCKH